MLVCIIYVGANQTFTNEMKLNWNVYYGRKEQSFWMMLWTEEQMMMIMEWVGWNMINCIFYIIKSKILLIKAIMYNMSLLNINMQLCNFNMKMKI